MKPILKVFTFGGLRIRLGDDPIPNLSTRKEEALLVYLLAAQKPLSREILADLLWDERSQRQALSNLRVVLTGLRKNLVQYLIITRETVAMNPEAEYWFDASELEERLNAIQQGGGIATAGQAEEVEEAVALYRGEFLEGFYARESRGFDEWMVRERERLHRLAVGGLHDLVEYSLQTGAYPPGIAQANRLLALDPLNETAHRQLMQLLAYNGQRSQALAQYEACRRLLWDELGVEPAATTKAFFEKLRQGEIIRPRPALRAIRGYELEEQIGSGSYGAVYRAFQPAVGREVAVKVILPQYANDPEFIRRFEVEAQLIARLEHPRITPVYDYWREPDGAYLVMRLLKGGSLETLLEAGPLEAQRAVELVEQVASGLATAHQQGIIHRDLKPANILLDEVGNAYLADFGLAKVLRGDGRQSKTGEFFGTPLYMSPEQIRSLPLTPQTDLYSFGLILYEMLVGKAPFPYGSLGELIDHHLYHPVPSVYEQRPDLPVEVDEVIERATAKDPTTRFPDALSLAAAFKRSLAGLPVAAIEEAPSRREFAGEITNPYKGLFAFQEADAPDFFGREALTERLVARLGEDGEACRFLAVVGPSGSGKSSLVKAGLIPALRNGALPGSEKWFIVEMLPGSHPFEELEVNLLRIATQLGLGLADQLQRDRRGLVRAAKLTLPSEGDELLLVIDQFEEVFTLVNDPGESRKFLDILHSAATEARSPVRVVVTLRADFYDRPLMHPDFSALMQSRTEVVVPLSVEELESAIRSPAERVGVGMEAGLVTAMVADMVQQPAALPLLQFALTELFERRGDHRIGLEDYQALGGVEGVLERRAEEVYAGLDEMGQESVRQMMLRLVTLGEGVEDTRRRALVAELEALGGFKFLPGSPVPSLADGAAAGSDAAEQSGAGVKAALDAFGGARLLSFDRDPLTRGPTVEIAHEALLREWRRLREWLDESRADLRQQRVLAAAAGDWVQGGREDSFLLHGIRLDQFAAWMETTNLALTRVERDFMEANLAGRAARRAAEAARQERELALERRARKFLRGLAAVFAIAALVAVILSLFAFNQQRIARQNASLAAQNEATAVVARDEAKDLADQRLRDAQINGSLALAAQSRLALQAGNLDLSLALAMEANRIPNPPGQVQMALSEVAYAPGTVRLFLGHQKPVWSVAISPDGRYGLSGDGFIEDQPAEGRAGEILLWDLETGEALRRLDGHTDLVTSLAFTPDGRHAVSGSWDKTIIYWNLETGRIIRRFPGHGDWVNGVAVSPDGRLAASASGRPPFGRLFSAEDNSVRLWDLQNGEEIRRFTSFTDGVTAVRFTHDGVKLVAATVSDGFELIDIQTGKALLRPGTSLSVFDFEQQVAVNPNSQVAIIAENTEVHLLNLQTGKLIKRLKGLNGQVMGLDISPDGQSALGGSEAVVEWDLQTGEEIRRFNFGANAVAYSPDGNRALIGSHDGSLRLLSLRSGAEIGRLPAGAGWVRGAAYSPDGRTLLMDDTGVLYRWDLETGEKLWSDTITQHFFWEISLNSNGTQALTNDNQGGVYLWDVATGELLKRLESDGSFVGHLDLIYSVVFHPSGKYALSGGSPAASGEGDTLIYWDTETGKPVHIFETGTVAGVAISPNGRTALSAEGNGTVNWWDLETGERLQQLEGHTSWVWSVAFIDDRTAISASEDSTMIQWDLENGKAMHNFLGHGAGIKRVVLSPDRRLALSASRDGTVILWNVQSGEPLRRYTGHTGELMTVAWRPDGAEALSGGRDNQAVRWRIDPALDTFLTWIRRNRYVRELTCGEREAFHVEPFCKGGTVATGTGAGGSSAPLNISGEPLLKPLPLPAPFPVATSTQTAADEAGTAVRGVNRGSIQPGVGQVWEYNGRAGELLSIRAAADLAANRTWGVEGQLAAGLLDLTLAIYAPDGSLLVEADDLENGVATDAYLAAINLPQAGTYLIKVRSYQDRTGGSYRLILSDPRPIVFTAGLPSTAGLAIHPNSSLALVGIGETPIPILSGAAAENPIIIWNLTTGQEVRLLEGHTNTPVGIAISHDGKRALSAGRDGVAILWDLETWAEIGRLDNQGIAFSGILFSPDGRSALTASEANLAVWDLESGEQIRRFEGHEDLINNLALSPDWKTAYSTSLDGTLRFWDLASGEQIGDAYRPFAAGQTYGLAVSPDGSRLLVGSGDWTAPDIQNQDATIALLDAMTGEVLLTLKGHTSLVQSLAFSPDGRYAISGSADETLRFWDLTTGESLAVLTGHTGEVWRVVFSSDGLSAYSTSLDGSLRVWDLSDFIPNPKSP